MPLIARRPKKLFNAAALMGLGHPGGGGGGGAASFTPTFAAATSGFIGNAYVSPTVTLGTGTIVVCAFQAQGVSFPVTGVKVAGNAATSISGCSMGNYGGVWYYPGNVAATGTIEVDTGGTNYMYGCLVLGGLLITSTPTVVTGNAEYNNTTDPHTFANPLTIPTNGVGVAFVINDNGFSSDPGIGIWTSATEGSAMHQFVAAGGGPSWYTDGAYSTTATGSWLPSFKATAGSSFQGMNMVDAVWGP